MKLKITNFCNIDSLEIEGSKIYVQGENMSGKSNILKAVERVLFGTIQGRKNGITPVMNGEEHCNVKLTLGEVEYSRDETMPTAYMDSIWRAVMYGDLLNQEYTYIKKVCADVLLKDEAKPLFSKYRTGSVESSITNVKKEFTIENAIFLKAKNRIDFLNEQIDKLAQYNPETLENMDIALLAKNAEIEKYENAEGPSLDVLEKQIADAKDVVSKAEKIITEAKLRLNRQIMDTQKVIDQGKTLAEGKCPICSADYKDEAKLQETRVEYVEKTKIIEEIQAQVSGQESLITTVNETITSLQNERNELYAKGTTALGSKSTLTREANTQFQINISYGEKLKQKLDFETELQKNIDKLIECNNNPLFTINDDIAPKGKLNQLLQEKFSKLIPGYTISILEDSQYGELKSVFKIYDKDGIEYAQMSRGQRFYANIAFSLKLLAAAKSSLPLLIDDGEMFSKKHIMKLNTLFKETGVEYIMTKVTSTQLQVDVKE